MNTKLESIGKAASEDLLAFIREAEEKILQAWSACAEEAQDQETKPKFRLGFTITLDLDEDKMETALSWAIKHKVSRDAKIPDPDQIDLGLQNVDSTVTIKTGGGSTTVPFDTFKKVAKGLAELAKK